MMKLSLNTAMWMREVTAALFFTYILSSAFAPDSFNLPWAVEAPGEATPPTKEDGTLETHVVDEPPASLFRVRGPAYLQDRVKEPAEFHAMKLIGVDLVRSEVLLDHVCAAQCKAKVAALRARHGGSPGDALPAAVRRECECAQALRRREAAASG